MNTLCPDATDTEGFKVDPRPPLRLADLPAAFEAVAAEEAKPVLPWWFGTLDPVQQGGRR